MLLPVCNIQRFSTHDGPGLRTSIFLKGCPLRCKWCHNPEAQSTKQQIFYTPDRCIGCGACIQACEAHAHCIDPEGIHRFNVSLCKGCMKCTKVCPSGSVESVSEMMTTEEILKVVLSDKPFYGDKGGMTLTGGEPLIHPEGCLELLWLAREHGVNTVIETCGYFDSKYMKQLAELTDLFLWDFKDGNDSRHMENTGVSNKKIIENIKMMDKLNAKILLRSVLIKGINIDDCHLDALAKVYSELNNCIGVQLLEYHAYGGSKNAWLGYENNGRKEWIPSKDDMAYARNRLAELIEKYKCYN